jgi:hypothetical protein
MFDIPSTPKLKPFRSRYHLPAKHTRLQELEYIDDRKIESAQRLISALSTEKRTIEQYGPTSTQAMEAELESVRARRNFELWRKK